MTTPPPHPNKNWFKNLKKKSVELLVNKKVVVERSLMVAKFFFRSEGEVFMFQRVPKIARRRTWKLFYNG
jgi:hypothetical protein